MFRSKRADRIKILVWDGSGMVLIHKRLEGGKFVWPQVRDGVMRMSAGPARGPRSKDWIGGWCGPNADVGRSLPGDCGRVTRGPSS